jgi:hypothetical protein
MLPMIAGYVMGQRTAAKVAGMSVVANHMSVSGSSVEALAELDARVDRLLLVIEAMWGMMKEQGLTDEQLAARIAEIDNSDGVADGRRVIPAVTCRSCGSKVMGGLPRCQICGTDTGVVVGPLAGI